MFPSAYLEVYPFSQPPLSFPKLASRYSSAAWESLKNVTTHQRRLSSEHLQASKNHPHLLPGRQFNDTPYISNHPKTLSCRSSYLGIRNFFVNSSVHCREPRNVVSPSQRCQFSTTAQNDFQPSDIVGGAEVSHLTTEEEERSQSRDFYASLNSASDTSTPRYDWRLRASSRMRPAMALAGKGHDGHNSHRQTPKRILPPQIHVHRGEPFYEEIKAYSDRYVASLFAT